MENTGLKTKLNILEAYAYRVLNIFFSLVIGYLMSKAGIKSIFSPFSLSFLAISPSTQLSVVFTYLGTILGFVTKDFSAFNFKYICANTFMLIVILISGNKNYLKNVYTPVLPGVICFACGFIFLFAEEFSVYNFLLLVCESLLCSCTAYFAKYFFDAVSRSVRFDSKDIIAFNITLLMFLCAIDYYYIFGFSVSVIFLILIIYLCDYYLERKTAALFSLTVCLVLALLHSGYNYFFLVIYVPALISIAVSKFDKRYIVISYYIPYLTISAMTGTFGFNLNMYLCPLVCAVLYYLIPKNKISNYLSKYINVFTPVTETSSGDHDKLCDRYCEEIKSLVKGINITEVSPILDTRIENKLKRFLFTGGCRDISISNYYNIYGKQIVSVSFKNGDKVNAGSVKNKLSELSGKSFIICSSENGTYKFENADRFKIDCYALYKAKRGEQICGDSVSAFKRPGCDYSLILADGMGSGKEAYVKSCETVSILKKLLKSDITPEKALEAVNSSIFLIEDNMGFSTIDLCNISLENGVANFYKCGAYVSFVLKGNKLIEIEGGGFPAGISDNMSMLQKTIQLENGDKIIMVSDGVINSIEQIRAAILLNENDSLENTARELIDCAYKSTPCDRDDDMTVLVAKVIERKFE